jgi:hypothetical protein
MLGWELSVNVSTTHWFFGRWLRQQLSGGQDSGSRGTRWAQDSARLLAYRGLQCTLSSRSWLLGCYLQFPAACNVKLYKLGSVLWACTKTSKTYLFHIISSKWLQGSFMMMLISFVPCDASVDKDGIAMAEWLKPLQERNCVNIPFKKQLSLIRLNFCWVCSANKQGGEGVAALCILSNSSQAIDQLLQHWGMGQLVWE